MRIATTQAVRTELSPWDVMPRGRPPRAEAARGAPSADEGLTQLAQKWVAQTFFGALLAQMRNSPFKSELFSGGRGGEAFGALFDQHLAERMARGAGRGLAQSIVRHIEGRSHKVAEAPEGKASDRMDAPGYGAARAVDSASDGGG